MDPALMLALIQSARTLIDGLVEQATIIRREGGITDAELDAIRTAAARTGAEWDRRVQSAQSGSAGIDRSV